MGEVLLERSVGPFDDGARAHAKCFAVEALENQLQLRFGRLAKHDAAIGGFPKLNFVHFAELAHAVHVTEEIQRETFVGCERWKSCGPDRGCFFTPHRFATFGAQQLQSDGLDLPTEVERFNVQRKWRQIHRSTAQRRIPCRAHSTCSCSSGGNFVVNSGDCFRTSSQSKKTSGVSSQMRNQLAISSFSARFCGSTLGFREIISARRFPRRATFKTLSTAARSPWV